MIYCAICSRYSSTLEGLCVEAIFSSLFQPRFRAHKPGRKIAKAAGGHCHNSHTWPFGQEEVQLREFVSTLHVKPLSGPGNLAADEPQEHSEQQHRHVPTQRILRRRPLPSTSLPGVHHPLPQQQGCSGIYSALCTKLHATQPLARDVSTLLKGEGGLMTIALEGLCFTASFPRLHVYHSCHKDQQYHKTWH